MAVAADGAEGLRLFADHRPDIVLLDMLLPGMHGIEVRLRSQSAVPVVMVSAVDAELDVVLELELGAADYVTKPFHLRELVARMQAILRRVSPPEDSLPTAQVVESTVGDGGTTGGATAFGSVTVDFDRREVRVGGDQTHLSRREFDLLAALLFPARRVRTRAELIDLLWPDRRGDRALRHSAKATVHVVERAGIRRITEQLGRRSGLDQLPGPVLVHQQEGAAVRDPHGLLHVVGHDHDRDPVLELPDEFFDPLGGDRVERRGGLVHEQHFGFDGQCAGDAEALLLTAREGGRVPFIRSRTLSQSAAATSADSAASSRSAFLRTPLKRSPATVFS